MDLLLIFILVIIIQQVRYCMLMSIGG